MNAVLSCYADSTWSNREESNFPWLRIDCTYPNTPVKFPASAQVWVSWMQNTKKPPQHMPKFKGCSSPTSYRFPVTAIRKWYKKTGILTRVRRECGLTPPELALPVNNSRLCSMAPHSFLKSLMVLLIIQMLKAHWKQIFFILRI